MDPELAKLVAGMDKEEILEMAEGMEQWAKMLRCRNCGACGRGMRVCSQQPKHFEPGPN